MMINYELMYGLWEIEMITTGQMFLIMWISMILIIMHNNLKG